jgi:hypothetical protein
MEYAKSSPSPSSSAAWEKNVRNHNNRWQCYACDSIFVWHSFESLQGIPIVCVIYCRCDTARRRDGSKQQGRCHRQQCIRRPNKKHDTTAVGGSYQMWEMARFVLCFVFANRIFWGVEEQDFDWSSHPGQFSVVPVLLFCPGGIIVVFAHITE